MTNSEPPSTPTTPAATRPPSTNSTSSAAPAPVPTAAAASKPTETPTAIAQERRDWAELATQLAGPDPVVESYLQKVGRQNMARLQASEILRAGSPDTAVDQADTDCPLPPELPADPTHPLNAEADLLSDLDYQTALDQWRTTEEYQGPLRQYQAWQRRR